MFFNFPIHQPLDSRSSHFEVNPSSSSPESTPHRAQRQRRNALRQVQINNQASPSHRRVPQADGTSLSPPNAGPQRVLRRHHPHSGATQRTHDENRPPTPNRRHSTGSSMLSPSPRLGTPMEGVETASVTIARTTTIPSKRFSFSGTAVGNRRSIAQKARRERERLERENGTPRFVATGSSRAQQPMGNNEQDHQQTDDIQMDEHGRISSACGPASVELPEPSNLHQRALQYNKKKLQRSRALFLAARKPYREPAERHDLGRMEFPCEKCGALHWFDERVVRGSVGAPKFGMCCDHGQVRLPPIRDPPPPLRSLFVDNTPVATEFRENLWKYNRAFAFTSLAVREDHSINQRGRGEPVFRIMGELCHRVGPLQPAPGHSPIYAQLYIYDPQEAMEHRRKNNVNLRPDTLQLIQDVLLDHNPYVAIYRHAHEILAASSPGDEDVSVRLRTAPGLDRRRYNTPTADEVAVILPNDPSNTEPRDIRLHSRDGVLRTISDLHPAYCPLYYVLLFPHGDSGWHPHMQLHQPDKANPRRLTLSRFVAYRLQVRRTQFSTIHRSRRLLQRFLVDMYAAVDQSRLLWLRLNQGKLRASLHNGLEDAFSQNDDNPTPHDLGQRFILPSSYIGGPRHMYQRFQDSMAIARYYGSVDVFMTVTCNPNWAEIERELLPGQTAYDRPDLVSRVFQLKKKAILDYIFKHGVFGHAVAYVYTIEFQKRGLPHMHLLIFLEEPYKLSTADAIDSCIWARWPDPETQPMLFSTVMNCMVHGPCGAHNPSAPCMENGKCTKGYPKAFQPFTTMDTNGFPLYFRPDDGRVYHKKNVPVDNRWIVAYSPFFSAEFDCHINCECAVSLGSFKYLFKYIQKGGDLASMEVYRRDEIQGHLDGRYISAAESVHHLFHFDVHDQKPNVVRLPVHLPGQHMVVFDPNEDPDLILERGRQERTHLTAFFDANLDATLRSAAEQYTYQEFPQHFVWHDSTKRWKVRQQGNLALGRMYFLPPTAGERFYLRTLLTTVKGPRSFDDLKTVNGTVLPSFHAACLALGLLQDDGEWRQCLQEAASMQTGARLRHLFVTILLFCEPSQPDVLWNDFRSSICDDLQYQLSRFGLRNPSNEDAYDYGLHLLNTILSTSGHSLSDWPSMPCPTRDWAQHSENPLLAEQLDYDVTAEAAELTRVLPLLNDEQRQAYDSVISSISEEHGHLFFLSGPGGTGKTFVYKALCNKIRSQSWIAICVSSSGISALLIPGGRTSHSMFKIPIDGITPDSLCHIPKQSQRAQLLRIARAIIWDEIGPQHRFAPEAVDRTLQDIRNSDRPFGGLTVVFGGDFQQTLPVVPRGSREEIVEATLQRSSLWEHIHVLRLHRNMRVEGDSDAESFSEWLLDIGHGRGTADDGTINLPSDIVTDSALSLINFIYPTIDRFPPPPAAYFLDRMVLAPRNEDIYKLNETILERMSGDVHTFYSADQMINEPGADRSNNHIPITVEFLRAINAPSLPPGELKLKVGCPLILLRNLAPSRGLCNGTRMILLRCSERVLEVQLIGGERHGQTEFIPRISLTPSTLTDVSFKFRRRQFPVRLAFALTINKAQGQSVKWVGLDLRVPVFAHGQLYVALSRATSRHRLQVLLGKSAEAEIDDSEIGEPTTLNVVYPEVLLD